VKTRPVLSELKTLKDTSKTRHFSFHLVLLATLGLLVIGFSATAAGEGINSAEVTDRVDKDGDGYLSSFTVTVEADAEVDESGDNYGGGAFENKGHPSFSVAFSEYKGPVQTGMYTETAGKDSITFDMTFNWQDMKEESEKVDSSTYPIWHNNQYDVLNGQKDVEKIQVDFWESDTPGEIDGNSDEQVAVTNKKLSDPIKIEKPAKDTTEQVSIESTPSDATVYIDGEKKGTTDWTGKLATDLKEREGFVTVRLEKNGYNTLTDKTQLSPPDDRDYDMEKTEKPLVIDSDPDGASVYVDGQDIGMTPVSKDYWVNEEFDVRVEKDGYETATIEGMTPGNHKAVTLESTSTSDTNDSTGDYDFYDPTLTTDFSSLEYQSDLITELPDLRGWIVPKFTVRHDSGTVQAVKDSVRFVPTETIYLGNDTPEYRWDFGDGETQVKGPKAVVSHYYDSPGNYTVNLTVAGDEGTASTTQYVVVESALPQPAVDIGAKRITEGEPVTFDAGSSKDFDGTVQSYSWDMGDGTTKTGEKISYVYDSSGEYIINLDVTDNSGATETLTRTVNVVESNTAPKPKFGASSTTADTGETVSFDASGSIDVDGTVDQYYWNFGDGLSDTGTQVDHSYDASGTYTVELTAADSMQDTATVTKTITVQASNNQEKESASEEDSREQSNGSSEDDSKEKSNETTDDNNGGGSSIQVIVSFFQSLFG